jgi:hypothetical protein
MTAPVASFGPVPLEAPVGHTTACLDTPTDAAPFNRVVPPNSD